MSGTLTLVSTGANGPGNGFSLRPVISADGTKVAFESFATTLVAGDTNEATDVFVKDLATGALTLVSTGASGLGNSFSLRPSLSANGTKVAFISNASNLVAGDTNGTADVFVKDLATGALTLVSTGASGPGNDASDAPSLSADGTRVAFTSSASNLVASDVNDRSDVFVRDLATGALTLVSTGASGQGNDVSDTPSISADGTRVAFTSFASNLVAGDTNKRGDVFVRNLATGAVTLVSTGASGQGNDVSDTPSISADGTRIAFSSFASNLVTGDTNSGEDAFLKDLATGTIVLVSAGANGQQSEGSFPDPSLSADGTRVAFSSPASNLVAGDTNGTDDVFVRALPAVAGTTTTIGAGPDTLVLRIAQDAYQGSAQYTLAVDGAQVGGVLTASALRGSGQVDTINVLGNLAPGAHEVRLTFLNDRYDGTPATDRNLFLTGAAYNGAEITGAVRQLYSAGPASFGFSEPVPPGTTIGAGPDTLVLRIAQDAYQGSAQYTVAVDGVQVGGVLTASALRGSGRSDTINVLGNLAPGAHEVRLTFLNDRYDGTPTTDRTLFLDGATYNGVAVASAVRQLYSAGPVSFGFTEGSAGSAASGLLA